MPNRFTSLLHDAVPPPAPHPWGVFEVGAPAGYRRLAAYDRSGAEVESYQARADLFKAEPAYAVLMQTLLDLEPTLHLVD